MHSRMKWISAATLWAVLAGQHTAAGDLNGEVESMFNNLGAIGNYTAPGAFRGQTYNTFSGGGLMLRTQNKTYQLMALNLPTAKAGCGGIDLFGGSFSHISAAEFKNMLRNITAALPGVAFQVAVDAVSPLLGGVGKWVKNIESMLTNANINTCSTAKSLVSSAMEMTGLSSDKVCEDLAVSLGLESDYAAARVRCRSDKAGVVAAARGSGDEQIKNKAPFVGNLTWKALQLAGTNLDDAQRELIMSIVGTVIFYDEGRDPNPIPPTITSISRLLYGIADIDEQRVKQEVLKCNNFGSCDEVVIDDNYSHLPFTVKVEQMMRSIADKIANRTPIPNNSPEVGFVNLTSEPVYRMLSAGSAVPSADVTNDLIVRYRDLIAADYAYVFLEKNLRLGMAALQKNYTLDSKQVRHAEELRQRAGDMLTQISREKALLYQKVGSVNTVASQIEQLERQMRSNMPQYVLDLLGRRAAYGKP